MLGATEPDPAWTVVRADGRTAYTLAENPEWARLEGETELVLRALRAGDTLALEVPEVVVDRLDAGGERPFTDWQLLDVRAADGTVLPVTLAAVDPAARLAPRADRRLVLVRLPASPAVGDLLSVRVRWRQEVPWASVERLPTETRINDVAAPLGPALVRLAGDHRPFPYALDVTVPVGAVVVVSGRSDDPVIDGLRSRVHSEGDVGPEAVVTAGEWRLADLGAVRVAAPGASRAAALAVAEVTVPLETWSGVRLGPTDFVQLPASFRPPAGRWGEGVAAIRPWLRFDQDVRAEVLYEGLGPSGLPDLPTVLGGEALAASAWAGRVGATAEGAVWIEAFGRAFAIDVLSARSALAWRDWLQRCSIPLAGMSPALSPHAAATTAFRDTAARCAGPLIVGPMLDDRLGTTRARLVRRAVFASGTVDADAIRAAVLAENPGAGPWLDRWIDGGQPVRVEATWSATPTDHGARVRGTVSADSVLGGAPVLLRFQRGTQQFDLSVRGDGVAVPFEAELPFVPRSVGIDPTHRLLRVPGPVAVR